MTDLLSQVAALRETAQGIKTRPPTAEVAAGAIMVLSRQRDRKAALLEFRRLYGDVFADGVQGQVKADWGKRNGTKLPALEKP